MRAEQRQMVSHCFPPQPHHNPSAVLSHTTHPHAAREAVSNRFAPRTYRHTPPFCILVCLIVIGVKIVTCVTGLARAESKRPW
jgi:hypothetical protein